MLTLRSTALGLAVLALSGAAAIWAASDGTPETRQALEQPASVEQPATAQTVADVAPASELPQSPPVVAPAPVLAAPTDDAPKAASASEPAPALSSPPIDEDVELRRAAGQLLMVGFFGRSARDATVRQVLDAIRSGLVGGVIVMDRNITNVRQTKALVSALEAAAPADKPLLISVDQEGGAVQRIDSPGRRRRFPSAWRLAKAADMDRVRATYAIMSRQLAGLGFNLNFGPVVDLRLNPRNPIIARKNRSFGDDPALVADHARVFVDAHHREGIATTLKHFPGHGSSWGDTHHGFVNITRPFQDVELAPYAKLMASGHADTIMVGHLAHAAFGTKSETDKRPMPASLSSVAIRTVLREELGFDGVVITDDLAMGAIKRYFNLEQTVQKALVAGNDILLMTSGPRGMTNLGPVMHAAVIGAVRDGLVSRADVLRHARRVRRLKASVAEWGRIAAVRRARETAERKAAAEKEAERKRAEAAARAETSAPQLKGAVD